MTGPLRHCDRPGCRLCRVQDRDAQDVMPADTLPMMLVAGAMFLGLIVLVFVILPELARQAPVLS